MIKFNRSAFNAMFLAVQMREGETCGILHFEKEGNDYIISDFKWAEYTGRPDPSMSTRDLSTDAYTVIDPKVLYDYHKDRAANVWFHSHANLDCFWSGIDVNCIRKWIGQELISVVCNKKGDILIRKDTAFLTGIETLKLFEGNKDSLPKGFLIGKGQTAQQREELKECLRSSQDNKTSSSQLALRLPLWEQEELEAQQP